MPFALRNGSGSKDSSGLGETASSTRGSASDAKALPTPCQIESRVRLSAFTIDSSESAQPSAAAGSRCRIRTASLAAAGDSAH